jgi:hypothetical protein
MSQEGRVSHKSYCWIPKGSSPCGLGLKLQGLCCSDLTVHNLVNWAVWYLGGAMSTTGLGFSQQHHSSVWHWRGTSLGALAGADKT